MMTKRELQKSIEECTGTAFPNLTQISKAINRGNDYTRKLLMHTKCWQERQSKLYYSGDIADALLNKFE